MRMMKTFVAGSRVVLLLACLLAVASCQSAPKPHAEQQIVPADKEAALADELDANLVKTYGKWREPAVESILNAILATLAKADPKIASDVAGAHVVLLKTRVPYVAAGLAKRIYVSRGLLATMYYENELAFVLAMQLVLVKERATTRNLATLHSQEVGENLVVLPTTPTLTQKNYLEKGWFEAGGLFDFGEKTYLQGEQDGIELAYKAKYDPRGAISLMQRWTTAPMAHALQALGKILPEADVQMKTVRDEVAKLSPLRDPIVKSAAFEELQSRLQIKKAKHQRKVN